MAKGRIKVQCFRDDTYVPIDNARITITPTRNTRQEPGQIPNYSQTDINLTTNSSGETVTVEVEAPPLEYSQQPSDNLPYSNYDVRVERDGFEPLIINGCQVFPDEIALQHCELKESARRSYRAEVINVPPNVLNGNYPNKIPEPEEKPLPPPTGGVVLPQPVVPEFIVVHAGTPDNTSAPNYTVRYTDYIKNVASCEIYSTWSDNTIRANIYAIISFTLNRIYTEWYRGKGKDFDITNSTAFDHAFTYGRNFFESISRVVDDIFATYIKRIGKKQPLLTQYCDGKNVQCPNWMTQWGSKELGDQGRTPYEILTYYYGSDIELVTAEKVRGIPKSYPGYALREGSVGPEVRSVQEYLNRISDNYPLIPKVPVDGNFGPKTTEAVKVFQSIFNLPQTGVVDYATWYKISDVYVGVTKIAELRRGCESIFVPPLTFENECDNAIPTIKYKDDLF